MYVPQRVQINNAMYAYDVEMKEVRKVIQQENTIQYRTEILFLLQLRHDPSYDGRAPCMHLEPKDFSYHIVKDVLKEANKWMNKDFNSID